jgi:hypothetical protein
LKSRSRRQCVAVAVFCTVTSVEGLAAADERVEVTGNVYCRNAEDAVERPFGRVRVFIKQRPDIIADSSSGNGKFRLLVPATEVVDRDVEVVYSDARLQLGQESRHVTRDDLTTAAGRTVLVLPPRIFVSARCKELDPAGLRETVRLAVERMSHRAAVVHSELVRAHSAANAETSVCLNSALSRIGAHLRFAESRVPIFTDTVDDDPIRAHREVTAIKIADERVAELVEEADNCLERNAAQLPTSETTKYGPDPLVSPSDLTSIDDPSLRHPPPWGRSRPGAASLPADDEWHFYPGFGFETGYDSNFMQKHQGNGRPSSPAAWQWRPSAHLSMRRYDLKVARSAPATMQTGPVQSANISLVGLLITSTQSGGRDLGPYRDVAVAADFTNRFGDDGPLGGIISAKYDRVVEASNEPENAASFGTNIIGLGVEALARPGAGRFEAGLAYRLGLHYHDATYQRQYNRVRHTLALRERWLFLPETALVHETEISSLTYIGAQMTLNDSVQIRSRIGLVGVVSKSVAIEALVGYGESYYGSERGASIDPERPLVHGKLEWFFGPIAPRAYPSQAMVRPSLALTYDHDYRDNVTSDYYTFDRGAADLSLNYDERWYFGIHGGLSRNSIPRSRYYNYYEQNIWTYPKFHETRIDLAFALEYRIMPQLRFSLSVRYDENVAKKKIPVDPVELGLPESVAFQRTRIYGGAIWTM